MQTKPAASLLISSGELRRQKHFICSRLGALALSSSYAWGSAQLTGKQRLKLCSLTISDSPKHQLWVEKAWCGFGCLFKVLALLLWRCKFFYISVSVLWKKINEQLLLETSTLSHIWKLFMQIVSKVIRSLKTKRNVLTKGQSNKNNQTSKWKIVCYCLPDQLQTHHSEREFHI